MTLRICDLAPGNLDEQQRRRFNKSYKGLIERKKTSWPNNFEQRDEILKRHMGQSRHVTAEAQRIIQERTGKAVQDDGDVNSSHQLWENREPSTRDNGTVTWL